MEVHVVARVLACDVCRTDVDITEGDLPALYPRIIPGHRIVGKVMDNATLCLPLETRVGVFWMGVVDGDCWYCQDHMENVCEYPVFT